MRHLRILFVVLALTSTTAAQPTPQSISLRVDPTTGQVRQLTAAERAELGDVFFERVLRDKAQLTKLTAVEQALDSRPEERIVFVIDEEIVDPQRRHTPRAVIGFKSEPLARNVMLSISFDADGFSDDPAPFEVWGWDGARGRYNYYRLHEVSGTRRWVFQGSSAELLAGSKSPCFRCHLNGAPLMKELFFPWNNWHSNASGAPAQYLTALAPAAIRWPVAADERLRRGLSDAAQLKTDVMLPSIRRFNQARIAQAIGPDGRIDKRVLRPLFETTEFNIATSRTASGLHPLSANVVGQPGQDVAIPNSFFLNADLIAGNPQVGLVGLDLSQARDFTAVAKIPSAEYLELLTVKKQVMRTAPPKFGDTQFAWLTPEPSFIDNDLIDQLLQQNRVPQGFVAAALAIDLRIPILSDRRRAVFAILPSQLTPGAPMIAEVVAALEAHTITDGSAEAEFLNNLRRPDPKAHLGDLVARYREEIATAFGVVATRKSTAQELYVRLALRRKSIETHAQFKTLIESKLLFPTTAP